MDGGGERPVAHGARGSHFSGRRCSALGGRCALVDRGLQDRTSRGPYSGSGAARTAPAICGAARSLRRSAAHAARRRQANSRGDLLSAYEGAGLVGSRAIMRSAAIRGRAADAQCAIKYTPMHTSTAAAQRLWSTFSLRKNLAAKALTTRGSDAETGATRLSGMRFSASSSRKNATARNANPAKNRGQERTARMTPAKPRRSRILSRSPSDFMAADMKTSPVLEDTTMAEMMIAAAQKPARCAPAGMVIARPPAKQARVHAHSQYGGALTMGPAPQSWHRW